MTTASVTFTSRNLESAASETFSIEEAETREIESYAIAFIWNKMYLFSELYLFSCYISLLPLV